MHQKTTSHAGDSRPRNESSSMPRGALQQRRLTATIGEGQKTDRISSAMKPADARRRLASIDIEPFSDHLDLIDAAITAQRVCDFGRVNAAGRDDRRVADVVRVHVPHALELARKVVTAPQIR